MLGIHSNCVPKAQYWAMYHNFKDDGYYTEYRKLRLENKLLKDTIVDLESKLSLHLTPSPALVVNPVKYNRVSISRGSQLNNKEKPVDTEYIEYTEYNLNRCKAIRKSNNRQCKQCNNPNQSGGPILNGYCGYHSHYR